MQGEFHTLLFNCQLTCHLAFRLNVERVYNAQLATSPSINPPPSQGQSAIPKGTFDIRRIWGYTTTTAATIKSDLDIYLDAPIVSYVEVKWDAERGWRKVEGDRDKPADALEWWKVSDSLHFGLTLAHILFSFQEIGQRSFPTLVPLVRDTFTVPGTTVDMEREFSKASDLVVQKQGWLSGEHIRQCMCLKSWIEKGAFDIVKYWEQRSLRI